MELLNICCSAYTVRHGRKGIFVDLSSRREKEERLKKKKGTIKIRTRCAGTSTVCSSSYTSRFMLRPQRKTDRGICRLPRTRSQGATSADFGATISSGGFGWCRGSGIAGVGLRHAPGIRVARREHRTHLCSREVACLYVAAAEVKKAKEKKGKCAGRPLDIIILLRKKRCPCLCLLGLRYFSQTSRCHYRVSLFIREFFWKYRENRTELSTC